MVARFEFPAGVQINADVKAALFQTGNEIMEAIKLLRVERQAVRCFPVQQSFFKVMQADGVVTEPFRIPDKFFNLVPI